jgi:hypothetical protein
MSMANGYEVARRWGQKNEERKGKIINGKIIAGKMKNPRS